jgi:hypothetical protein
VKKEKAKAKAEKSVADGRATPSVDVPKSGKGTPAPDTLSSDGGDAPEAPASPAPDSTGAATPTSRRPPRNPWTLFVRMDQPLAEAQLRTFFGEANEGIIRIVYPQSFLGKSQKIAYVEFGDEDAMKAGLDKHLEVGTLSSYSFRRG